MQPRICLASTTRVLQHIVRSQKPTFTFTRRSSTSHAQNATDIKGTNDKASASHDTPEKNEAQASEQPAKKKSILQQDEELRQKMSGLSGDGGDAGIEYEDGKPADMKRSVKNNMFRYI